MHILHVTTRSRTRAKTHLTIDSWGYTSTPRVFTAALKFSTETEEFTFTDLLPFPCANMMEKHWSRHSAQDNRNGRLYWLFILQELFTSYLSVTLSTRDPRLDPAFLLDSDRSGMLPSGAKCHTGLLMTPGLAGSRQRFSWDTAQDATGRATSHQYKVK